MLSQDCTSSIQRIEKVWRKLSHSARAWAAENSVGIAAVIRTLHFLTALCSLPRTLQCLFCLVSVNWLKRKEHPALKSSGILYNCNTVSHCKCVIYVWYYFKKWGICLYIHIYIPMLSSMKHLPHWLHRTRTTWNTPCKRGAERDAVLSVLFIKITEHNFTSSKVPYILRRFWLMFNKDTESTVSMCKAWMHLRVDSLSLLWTTKTLRKLLPVIHFSPAHPSTKKRRNHK